MIRLVKFKIGKNVGESMPKVDGIFSRSKYLHEKIPIQMKIFLISLKITHYFQNSRTRIIGDVFKYTYTYTHIHILNNWGFKVYFWHK